MNRLALGLLLVGGSLAALSCSSPMSSAPTGVPTGGPAAVMVTIVAQDGSMSFSPNPVTLHVGQAIAWKNGDTIVHQVVQDSSGGAGGGGYGGGGSGGSGFTTDPVAPGAVTSSIAFPTTGVVTYHCAIHPTMRGTITTTN